MIDDRHLELMESGGGVVAKQLERVRAHIPSMGAHRTLRAPGHKMPAIPLATAGFSATMRARMRCGMAAAAGATRVARWRTGNPAAPEADLGASAKPAPASRATIRSGFSSHGG